MLWLFLIVLKHEILIEKARYKQGEFNRYLKKMRIGNKSETKKIIG